MTGRWLSSIKVNSIKLNFSYLVGVSSVLGAALGERRRTRRLRRLRSRSARRHRRHRRHFPIARVFLQRLQQTNNNNNNFNFLLILSSIYYNETQIVANLITIKLNGFSSDGFTPQSKGEQMRYAEYRPGVLLTTTSSTSCPSPTHLLTTHHLTTPPIIISVQLISS